MPTQGERTNYRLFKSRKRAGDIYKVGRFSVLPLRGRKCETKIFDDRDEILETGRDGRKRVAKENVCFYFMLLKYDSSGKVGWL